MADADRVAQITNDLEASYQSLQQSAQNISGLLSLGVATCDEVKAYNLWALATYNAQQGMLSELKAAGQDGVPDAPPYPTLFAWNDVTGEDALNIDCTGQATSLSGAMARALTGPDANTVYLGLDRIKIITTNQYDYNPSASPGFNQLLAQQQQAGLGIEPITLTILIAGIAIGLYYAVISPLMAYLTKSKLEEELTGEVKQQAQAFASYTSARVQCYNACITSGKSSADCTATCQKLVDKPNIKVPCLPGQPDCDQKWGLLQWTGFTVITGIALMVGWKLYERHREGKSFIPSFDEFEAAHEAPH
jgi:hypothetical protein